MKSDSELLQEFSVQRSQDAFAQLVGRHVDLVYSAALRQVNGDVHLARDVAQQVFIALARKAKSLRARESLVGWLYTSAHHAAANAVRSERRRRTHEQESFAMHQIDQQENNRPDWERLRPVLDAAMLELDEADRDAVLRRFFSGESFAAIGDALELSHDAARKRVERALDRLHGFLARRGITSSASALGLTLSQHAVAAAPSGLGTVVVHVAFSGGAFLSAGSLLLMNKIAVGFTAAMAAGLIALLMFEQRAQLSLEGELMIKKTEVAALKASQSVKEQALAAHEIRFREVLAARIAETPNAEPEQITPVTATERMRLDATHAGMFRRLRLDRDRLTALKDLLALRQRTDGEVRNVLKLRGISSQDLKWDDMQSLRLIAARDVDAKIGALLGQTGLEYVQTYERNAPHRYAFTQLETALAAYGEPLSPEQTDQLVAWTAEEADPRSSTISENVVARAASLLTPLQLEKLRLIQSAHAAVPQLMAANQAAALNGTLRLLPGSQREYAEWAAGSAKAPAANSPTP
ncbi:MAG: sigma-70 family RNA polymerase sigma factor [Opitutaceae bacterium]